MRKHNTVKAFTLIELLTVLAIIAALIGIGAGGLTALRDTVELNQFTNDFATAIRSIQSRARNGLVSETRFNSTGSIPQARVDGFAVSFITNSFNYCTRSVSAGTVSYNCSGQEAPFSVAFKIPANIVPSSSTNCRVVLFPRLTGDIAGMPSATSSPVDTGVCTITITQTKSGQTRQILIDFANNNIEIP